MKVNIFSLESVNSSINKLRNYQKTLETTYDEVVKDLTKKGYEYMISIVLEDTGNLKNSITWEFDKATQKGTIKIGTNYAIFVEYGTGIVGKNSPHPNAKGWKYDVNNHGMKGWWYFDNKQNRFRWTRGQLANAFIYKTVKLLKSESPKGVKVKLNGRYSESDF